MPSAIEIARALLESNNSELPQGNTEKFDPETDDTLNQLTESEDSEKSDEEESEDEEELAEDSHVDKFTIVHDGEVKDEDDEDEEELLKEESEEDSEESEDEEEEELSEDVKALDGSDAVDSAPNDATRKQFDSVSGHQEKAELVQKLLESADEDAKDEEEADELAETLTEGRKPKLPPAQHKKVKSLLAQNKSLRQQLFRLRDKDGYDSADETKVRQLLDKVHKNRAEVKKLLGQKSETLLRNQNEYEDDEKEVLKEADSVEAEIKASEKEDAEAEKVEKELTEQVLIEGRKPKLPPAQHAKLKKFLAANKSIRQKLARLRDKDGYDSANEEQIRKLLDQVHANRVEIKKLLPKKTETLLRNANDPSDDVESDESSETLKESFEQLVNLFETKTGSKSDKAFQKKAKIIFESTIDSIRDKISKDLRETYNAELGLAQIELKEQYDRSLDGYLDYIVESWMNENKVPLETKARNNLVEQFIPKLQQLLAEHHISIPDTKDEVVTTLAEEVVNLESENKKLLASVVEARETAKKHYALYLTESVGANLSETEKEKFAKQLLAGNTSDLKTKAELLVESFGKTPNNKKTSERKNLNPQLLAEGAYSLDRPFEQLDKPSSASVSIDQAVEHLSRMSRR